MINEQATKNNELISIVVPVYNVQQYLDSCVESVMKQTYTNWELLLVDDGSSDDSYALCCQWAQRDQRIRVFQNQHGGPAKARNTAIEAATGAFVYFIDSDDWIEPDTLELMHTSMLANDADVVVCGLYFDYPNRSKKVLYTNADCVLSREEALNRIITGKLPSYLCLFLLRRTVVQELYADYPCHEDYATGYKWFAHARRVVMLATAKYHYIQREGSVVHVHTDRNTQFLLQIYHERHQYIREHGLMPEDENRLNTVRNFLKLAKDYSRKPLDTTDKVAFVSRIKDEMQSYLPVGFWQLGVKRWLRLQLLHASVQLFVKYV